METALTQSGSIFPRGQAPIDPGWSKQRVPLKKSLLGVDHAQRI
jgi:hypothetical protein